MSDVIRIRMYQAGFGDCFLLLLPTADGLRTMLVDCGSLGGGKPAMKAVVPRLLEDVRALTGTAEGAPTHIDVIVATHRHKDHIGEFDRPEWAQVTAGEVWMPWTERPDDPIALRLRLAQERMASALAAALPADADPGLADLAANALSNQEARARLLRIGGAASSKLRWLAAESPGTNPFTTPVLPGVELHVLGPLRDEATFRDMDPPDTQNFARRVGFVAPAAAANGVDAGPGPFSSRWRLAKGSGSCTLNPREVGLLRQAIPDARFELLALNDSLINSTSIALMLKIGGTHLLLPGDAQWSTWDAALADPARRALLEKTSFYKVGHHGSENATPIEFVEGILKDRKDCVSMASWVTRANWDRIPEEHLVGGLKGVGPFADHESIAQGPTFRSDSAADGSTYYIEATIPVVD